MTGNQPRVRAPELHGTEWLNTGDHRPTLAALRGRIVLLDFWTFCCVNCLHVLDELRPVERRYADVLVTIGVHSPKFEHEKDPAAVAAAVRRYGVEHPVLHDPELSTWQRYTARAWPTLVVIDPEGYVVATLAGEGHAEGLDRLIGELEARHEAAGTLRRGGDPLYRPPAAESGTLRFPGRAVVLPGAGTLLVADSAQHRLVELAPDGETALRTIGSGTRGHADGPPDTAEFNEPQGLTLLPPKVAEQVGYPVVVADTVNHLLRGVRLDDGSVHTVAGTGRPWRSTVDHRPHDARATDLSSPWDVAWDPADRTVVVAMAGIHQLWRFDPIRRTVAASAGTTTEGLLDGPAEQAHLAQPSGLAVHGDRLWFVDAETSALRYLEHGEIHTAVGAGLFDFGHTDGPAEAALLQHPLGLAALPDGSIAVADTYNGAIRRYNPVTRAVTTLATDLAEPSDVLPLDNDLLVVESGAHRLTRLPAPAGTTTADATRYRTDRPASPLRPGDVTLTVVHTPPPGSKLDDSFGPPTRLTVTADPPELLLDGAGTDTALTRVLKLSDEIPAGTLSVTAQAATCDTDTANPACHLTRQDWGIPVTLSPDAPTDLTLVLRGIDT